MTKAEATVWSAKYSNEYSYANDRLASVSHNTASNACDVTYSFAYDALGRKTQVSVGKQPLSTNTYSDDRWGLLTRVDYGNGGKVRYAYDDYGRLASVGYDDGPADRYTYSYGANGQVAIVTDSFLGRTHQTEYDLAERPVQHTQRSASGTLQ